ncbi:hypothetical protein HYZ64_03210 [Candidatus Berkelbacteria bacterium]|nr:hypothetical protein [Candidatus Berkelbacteria bacterium]
MQKSTKKTRYVAEPQMICFSLRPDDHVATKEALKQVCEELNMIEGVGAITLLEIDGRCYALPFMTGRTAKRARTLLQHHVFVQHERGSDTEVEGYKINTVALFLPEHSDQILRVFDQFKQLHTTKQGEPA